MLVIDATTEFVVYTIYVCYIATWYTHGKITYSPGFVKRTVTTSKSKHGFMEIKKQFSWQTVQIVEMGDIAMYVGSLYWTGIECVAIV